MVDFAALKTRRVDGPMTATMLDDNWDRITGAFQNIYASLANGVTISDIRYTPEGTALVFEMSDGEIFGPLPIPGGFAIRGPWVTDRAYKIRDLVSLDGTTYVSTGDHQSTVFGDDVDAGLWEVFAAGASTKVRPPVWSVGRANVAGELLMVGDELYIVVTDFVSEDQALDISEYRIVSVRAPADALQVPGWISGYSYLERHMIIQEGGLLYIANEAHVAGETFAGDFAKWQLVSSGSGGGGGGSVPAWAPETAYAVGDIRRNAGLGSADTGVFICTTAHVSTVNLQGDRTNWRKLVAEETNHKFLTCTIRGTGAGGVLQVADYDGVVIAMPDLGAYTQRYDLVGISAGSFYAGEAGKSLSATIALKKTFNTDPAVTSVGTIEIVSGEDEAYVTISTPAANLGRNDMFIVEITAAAVLRDLFVTFAFVEK